MVARDCLLRILMRIVVGEEREILLLIGMCRGKLSLEAPTHRILLHGAPAIPAAAMPLGNIPRFRPGPRISPHDGESLLCHADRKGMIDEWRRILTIDPAARRLLNRGRHGPWHVDEDRRNTRQLRHPTFDEHPVWILLECLLGRVVDP